MSFLDNLLPDQRNLLVSLPYRVGLYVSQSDQSGGTGSQDAELLALTSIITAYSQEIFGAETVQYIVGETVLRKGEWKEWSKDVEMVVGECHKAIDILSDAVDEKEVSAFKRSMLEIGESVALAFREYGESTPMIDKIKIYMFYTKSRKEAAKQGIVAMEWDQFINISLDERKALQTIANALNTTYI
tara:strand:- start:3893 stop:4453 length:561 start_codon:yes stop_codon:yes gene_type:complete